MNKERRISDEMLVKYLLGEVSENEHNQVEQWIRESAANKNEFDSFRLIWEQSRELAPVSAVNENEAWARFQQYKLQPRPATRNIPLHKPYKWLKVAAILLLLAGGSWVAWYQANTNNPGFLAQKKQQQPPIAQMAEPVKAAEIPAQPAPSPEVTPAVAVKEPVKQDLQTNQVKPITKQLAHVRKFTPAVKNYYTKGAVTKTKTNGFICNDTPYPFEICIIQSVKCRNNEPSEVSTCSVLEPDQSGRLRYKAYDKIAKHCKATIDEIRITKISTGETIVLNDHSSPSTAQNFFNHITGKKKGDVFAGMFESDENCGLTFDSNFGNLKLQ